ncbi:MAG: hypothetical protein BWY92_00816 [Firmicutes bacterium ADurb.BinA052]|nr:MAG: hypothetical protein BWY92_00816 [Firmicutes bacterium ADurb.BinA052]
MESRPSRPAIALSMMAQSRTSRVIGPTVSRDDANATTPYLLTRPYVGFSPTTPQKDAGCLMEPPVSVPMDATASPAATAAAHPPLEPPGTLSRSQGFRVTWKTEV